MRLISFILLALLLFSCKKKDNKPEPSVAMQNGVLVLCEGLFQQNNASVSWIDLASDQVYNDFFFTKNNRSLGDTGNDLKRYGNKIYLVVNNSNTLEVMNLNGMSLKQLSMSVNGIGKQPRSIAFANGYAFVSCYDGFVDVIDTLSISVVSRIPVGSNPEGLAVSGNKLFVANSGGLNFPNVDSTVSVINLSTFTEESRIVVGKNPGSIEVDQNGEVYVIARGNYGSIPSRLVRIDPIAGQVVQNFTFDAGGIARMNEYFLISFYNYATQQSSVLLFNTATENVENSNFIATSGITTLYGVQFDPVKNKIYCMDAMNYTNSGYVRQFSAAGNYEKSYHVGLNPTKLLFYE